MFRVTFMAAWKKGAKDEKQRLQEDADLAAELGSTRDLSNPSLLRSGPESVSPNQAKFHPCATWADYCREFGRRQPCIRTFRVAEFLNDPLAVKANDCTIRCNDIILATHIPLMGNKGMFGAALFQTKLASYSSYALGRSWAPGTAPQAIFLR